MITTEEILKEITDNKQNYSQLTIELAQAIDVALIDEDKEAMIDYIHLIGKIVELIDNGNSSDGEALFGIKIMLLHKFK